jgi:hypothetical protein
VNECPFLKTGPACLDVCLWVLAAAAGVDQFETFSVVDVSGGPS